MDERERLAAVRRYNILDTPVERSFDRLASFAARLLKTPIALISFVDADRIWFKSSYGVNIQQMAREPGLCDSCVVFGKPWVITDAKADPRTGGNSLVEGELGAQFYLGVPLRSPDGFNLGTLCVLDVSPRVVTDDQINALVELAAVIVDELELRYAVATSQLAYRDELVRAELREDYIGGLSRELAHRSKNLLTVVHAIARQTVSSTNSIKDYVQRLGYRIRGLADTHELISESRWHGVTLEDLAWRHVDAFVPSRSRVAITGSHVILTPVAAQNIGLAFHELVTNASKFGALAVADGKVVIDWLTVEEGSRLRLSWRELDCAPTDQLKQGFGRRVLERIVPEALEGRAQVSFATGCLSWVLDVPTATVIATRDDVPEGDHFI